MEVRARRVEHAILASDSGLRYDPKALIEDGYQQTSGKYRRVARLPIGESGIQALRRADPDTYQAIMMRAERDCADTYRRVYANREGNQLVLTHEELRAFRKAGGGAA